MSWNEIKKRLKSPVVIIQLISIIVGVIVYFAPQIEAPLKVIVAGIVAIINLFAGVNNPSDKENF